MSHFLIFCTIKEIHTFRRIKDLRKFNKKIMLITLLQASANTANKMSQSGLYKKQKQLKIYQYLIYIICLYHLYPYYVYQKFIVRNRLMWLQRLRNTRIHLIFLFVTMRSQTQKVDSIILVQVRRLENWKSRQYKFQKEG